MSNTNNKTDKAQDVNTQSSQQKPKLMESKSKTNPKEVVNNTTTSPARKNQEKVSNKNQTPSSTKTAKIVENQINNPINVFFLTVIYPIRSQNFILVKKILKIRIFLIISIYLQIISIN